MKKIILNGEEVSPIVKHLDGDRVSFELEGESFDYELLPSRDFFCTLTRGEKIKTFPFFRGQGIIDGRDFFVEATSHVLPEEDKGGGTTAPMPGKILQIEVAIGDKVTPGQVLIVMEAMKMEHSIRANCGGVVRALPYEVGDMVEMGTELIVVES